MHFGFGALSGSDELLRGPQLDERHVGQRSDLVVQADCPIEILFHERAAGAGPGREGIVSGREWREQRMR